jgi:hypothetical protein
MHERDAGRARRGAHARGRAAAADEDEDEDDEGDDDPDGAYDDDADEADASSVTGAYGAYDAEDLRAFVGMGRAAGRAAGDLGDARAAGGPRADGYGFAYEHDS